MKRSRNDQRKHRTRRIRARISGTPQRPRVSVFRSLTGISAQVIDDTTGTTLCSASLRDVDGARNTVEGAAAVGTALAAKCAAQKITTVVFDRGGYRYHGKVKALAEALREGGLTF